MPQVAQDVQFEKAKVHSRVMQILYSIETLYSHTRVVSGQDCTGVI